MSSKLHPLYIQTAEPRLGSHNFSIILVFIICILAFEPPSPQLLFLVPQKKAVVINVTWSDNIDVKESFEFCAMEVIGDVV